MRSTGVASSSCRWAACSERSTHSRSWRHGLSPERISRLASRSWKWPRLKPREAEGPSAAFTVTALRFWKVAEAHALAEGALETARAVSQVTAKLRSKANAQLAAEGDGWSFGGKDYVGSLERRLRAIGEDAQLAKKEGLVVLSCVTRNDSV